MAATDQDLLLLARQAGMLLEARGLRLVTAESCTGGWVAKVITDIPGSSQWFERGFVVYSNAAKTELLGVSRSTLQTHGAVSREVAAAMACGAVRHALAQVSLAVTGVAGPGGGTPAKPVGLVWLAWCRGAANAVTEERHFRGGRDGIRRQAVAAVLQGLIDFLH